MGKIIKKTTELGRLNVVIANVVSRSAQSLTLAEKRILMAGIARMGGTNQRVKITANEYAETYDISLDTAYSQLKTAVENIFERYLQFQVWEGKKEGVERIRWIGGYRYFDKEGFVQFSFSNEIFPYLFELTDHFTKYQLQQAAALRSIHSWRLLELFEQMRSEKRGIKQKDGWLSIPLEEFWHAMEATESYRKNFNNLKKWIIEPAIKELSEKDGWLIQWEARKSGRKVVTLMFKFERNPQGSLFNQDSAPLPNKRTSKKKAHELATEQDVEEWVKSRTGGKITFSDDYIKKFAKKLYKYQTDKSSLSEDTIMQIEAALRFFGMDIPK